MDAIVDLNSIPALLPEPERAPREVTLDAKEALSEIRKKHLQIYSQKDVSLPLASSYSAAASPSADRLAVSPSPRLAASPAKGRDSVFDSNSEESEVDEGSSSPAGFEASDASSAADWQCQICSLDRCEGKLMLCDGCNKGMCMPLCVCVCVCVYVGVCL